VLKVEVILETGEVVPVSARQGQTLLHVLFEGGLGRGRPLCAGSGLCGKCAVRFVSGAPDPCADDIQRLHQADLKTGWRLACRHAVIRDCRIELPGRAPDVQPVGRGEGLAVDMGTTRIKWSVLSAGRAGPELSVFNPQMAVGSEVMSRLRYALSSAEARNHLRRSVLDVLRAAVSASGAQDMAVAANSTMISLLLDIPLEGLAYAPYGLAWSAGETVRLAPDLPQAYVPPLLGPFIGADVSAGLAHIVSLEPKYPYILADLGTNGEFVLAVDQNRYIACSVPMGPAIEGVGLCCGTTAGEGVMSRVELGPAGLVWDAHGISGISGTGYVSLLALLRRVGVIDAQGHFRAGSMPLARKVSERIREHRLGRVLGIEGDVFLAERDIEEFLKAKAGVEVGLQALLRRAGLDEEEVRTVYLAGALGEHVAPDDLMALGFLPEVWRERVVVAGNTALQGAVLALRDTAVRAWLTRLPRLVTVESLVDSEGFGPAFLRAMHFGWK
jgi:uncharacterized 2Fe-2S/4Fe-4S cluster protein (DUF4445 family)